MLETRISDRTCQAVFLSLFRRIFLENDGLYGWPVCVIARVMAFLLGYFLWAQCLLIRYSGGLVEQLLPHGMRRAISG